MKINIDEFRIDTAEQVEAPLDFNTLCALLAEHQAALPTARLARDVAGNGAEHRDPANPAVAVLLASPKKDVIGGGAQGSFHAAAAARFNERFR